MQIFHAWKHGDQAAVSAAVPIHYFLNLPGKSKHREDKYKLSIFLLLFPKLSVSRVSVPGSKVAIS